MFFMTFLFFEYLPIFFIIYLQLGRCVNTIIKFLSKYYNFDLLKIDRRQVMLGRSRMKGELFIVCQLLPSTVKLPQVYCLVGFHLEMKKKKGKEKRNK